MRTDEELNELLRRQSLILAVVESQLDAARMRLAALREAVEACKRVACFDIDEYGDPNGDMIVGGKEWDTLVALAEREGKDG